MCFLDWRVGLIRWVKGGVLLVVFCAVVWVCWGLWERGEAGRVGVEGDVGLVLDGVVDDLTRERITEGRVPSEEVGSKPISAYEDKVLATWTAYLTAKERGVVLEAGRMPNLEVEPGREEYRDYLRALEDWERRVQGR